MFFYLIGLSNVYDEDVVAGGSFLYVVKVYS